MHDHAHERRLARARRRDEQAFVGKLRHHERLARPKHIGAGTRRLVSDAIHKPGGLRRLGVVAGDDLESRLRLELREQRPRHVVVGGDVDHHLFARLAAPGKHDARRGEHRRGDRPTHRRDHAPPPAAGASDPDEAGVAGFTIFLSDPK